MKNYQSLEAAIKDIYGEERTIKDRRSLSGGDINEACRLTLDDGQQLFMKANSRAFLTCFEAEAVGLSAIRQTEAIRVPEVLGLGMNGTSSFLLLSYITGRQRIPRFWETFAIELAAMHSAPTPQDVGFGFASDNWIGASRQQNKPHKSWISFFRDCRLKPQFEMAEAYFSKEDKKKILYLLDHLDQFLIEPDRPSLIHGDLWSGNMMTGEDGKGWLIDPAVYYGHPEADIAMTELFGGFDRSFYEVYKETGGIGPDYDDRRDLYNLYHLLNHLNLFGGGYFSSVQRILNRYSR